MKKTRNMIKEWIVNSIIILVLLSFDQVSKLIILNKFKNRESLVLIKDFFSLTFVKNKGVAFGMFQNTVPFVVAITIITIVGIILYMHKAREEHSNFSRFGLCFILSGAIGNLLDRLLRGYVVDFFNFFGIWHYIFNVADVFINIGVILILMEFFVEKEQINK